MQKEDIELLIKNSERNKINTKRLNTLEKKLKDINSLTLIMKEITLEIKLINENINKIDKRILIIENKPIKRIEQIINNILYVLISGLVGYILLLLGLKWCYKN